MKGTRLGGVDFESRWGGLEGRGLGRLDWDGGKLEGAGKKGQGIFSISEEGVGAGYSKASVPSGLI